MKHCPDIVGNAKVVVFTPIDDRHDFTGACKQIVAGQTMGQMAGLAICQYDGETAYYLFGCDHQWNTVTATWHETLEDALDQAEFEYKGTRKTWTEK